MSNDLGLLESLTPSIRRAIVGHGEKPILAQVTETAALIVEADRMAAEQRVHLMGLVENAPRGSISQADLWHFYWFMDVRTESIAVHLGIPTNQVSGHLSPGPSMACQECGAPAAPTSRTHMRLSGARGRKPVLCSACADATESRRASQHAENAQRRAAQQNAREQRLVDLRSMPYEEYLRTPEWQETRMRALKRSHYRCQLCNQQSVLDVHHSTYERRGCEYARDVIVLCRDCHARHHGKHDS